MFLTVALYFLLACVLAAFALLPNFRNAVRLQVSQWVHRFTHLQRNAKSAAGSKVKQSLSQASDAAIGSTRWVASRWPLAILGMALLIIPPGIVFFLRGGRNLAAFDDSIVTPERNVVGALLQGEQLVPPPPLPPEVFTTAEVESVRPQLSSADRRWDLLDADFRQRLLLAYRLMKEEQGYEMALIEGYRSPERQNMLAGLGAQVTNAAAWQSYHQYGLAADSAFLRDGKLVITERDPWAMKGYELYGDIAQRVGLTWGGRWQNRDLGHVELRKPKALRSKVGD